MVLGGNIYIYIHSRQRTSVESGRTWQNLAEVNQVSRIRQNSVER